MRKQSSMVMFCSVFCSVLCDVLCDVFSIVVCAPLSAVFCDALYDTSCRKQETESSSARDSVRSSSGVGARYLPKRYTHRQ